MFSPRWRKVLADLWGNKTRTLLVVLSITVGVFAIGMIAGARTIVLRDLTAGYLATNPASATLTTDLFDDELLQAVRRMPGVADADARRTLALRVAAGPDTWKNLQLSAIADFDEQRINTVQVGSGAWPPGDRELLIERSTAAFLGAAIGDQLTVKTGDGTLRTLRVAGEAPCSRSRRSLWPGLRGTGHPLSSATTKALPVEDAPKAPHLIWSGSNPSGLNRHVNRHLNRHVNRHLLSYPTPPRSSTSAARWSSEQADWTSQKEAWRVLWRMAKKMSHAPITPPARLSKKSVRSGTRRVLRRAARLSRA